MSVLKIFQYKVHIQLKNRTRGTGEIINFEFSEKDREKMLALIDRYQSLPEEDRRAYQYLRRSLRGYDMDALKNLSEEELDRLRAAVSAENESDWAEKMNAYISRYI